MKLLLWLLAGYFFSPSFSLIDAFPVRISDVVLVPIIVFTVAQAYLNKDRVLINSTLITFFFFILICWISFGTNMDNSDVLYPIRFLSYGVFYFLLLAVACLFIYPYELGTIWASTDRVTLTFIGPYNVGLVFAMVLFLDRNFLSRTMSFLLVIMSGSRTMMLASALYGFFETLVNNKKHVFTLILAAVSVVVVAHVFTFDTRFVKGISKIDETIVHVIESSKVRPAARDKFDYDILFHSRSDDLPHASYDGLNIDFSLYLRFMTWFDVFKAGTQNNLVFMLGMGPGFYNSSTDSSFVRVFGETGIIGLSVYLLFLLASYGLLKLHNVHGIVVMFCASGLMIDTFYSSIALPLLLLILGYYSNNRKRCNP